MASAAILRRAVALGLALAVAGCAAAVPGYTPSTPRLEKYKANIQRGGGFDETGRYTLTEQELALDCKALTGSIVIKIVQMRDATNRTRPSVVASLAQRATRPVFGGAAYGASIADDVRADRARLEALNSQLTAKNCPAFDLDADLAPGNEKRPTPVRKARAASKS